MTYRIETKSAFRIVGVSRPLYKEVEKNFMVVPQMWQDAVINGTIQRLSLIHIYGLRGIANGQGFHSSPY